MDAAIIKLVDQAKEGNNTAFTKLYNKYKQNIWYTILNIVKNTDIADDLLSVVFTKAYVKLQSYINHISFEMWLKTIAVNTAIDYIRKYKNEQLNNYVDDEDCKMQLEGLEKSPEEKMILQEKIKIVNKVIPTLKKKYRDLIEARISGMTYKEMAEKFNLTELSVKSLLNKARQKLKTKFNKIV